jgi:N-acetylglutamate synthase-like GNAT family acetyltransferase
MQAPPGNQPLIEIVGSDQLEGALGLLFADELPAERELRVAAALDEIGQAKDSQDVVLAARADGGCVGAVWLQIRPGGVASLWRPAVAAKQPESLALQLIAAALDAAVSAKVNLVTTLLAHRAAREASWLAGCGFSHAFDLVYLVSPVAVFPSAAPRGPLEYEPFTMDGWDRMGAIIERTYVGSRDCPAVQKLRTIEEVLRGYRAIGHFDPARWLFVRKDGRDIGCLLLAQYGDATQWELVYLGLAPEARGHGFGVEMVRRAQWLAHGGGAEQLALAADADNAPALNMYWAAGFAARDQRSVFLLSLREGAVAG